MLAPPWFIEMVSFDPEQKRLDQLLDFHADRSIRAQSDETSKVAPFMLKARVSICQGEEYSLIFNSRG